MIAPVTLRLHCLDCGETWDDAPLAGVFICLCPGTLIKYATLGGKAFIATGTVAAPLRPTFWEKITGWFR